MPPKSRRYPSRQSRNRQAADLWGQYKAMARTIRSFENCPPDRADRADRDGSADRAMALHGRRRFAPPAFDAPSSSRSESPRTARPRASGGRGPSARTTAGTRVSPFAGYARFCAAVNPLRCTGRRSRKSKRADIPAGRTGGAVERESAETEERALVHVAATRAKRELPVPSFGRPRRFLAHG